MTPESPFTGARECEIVASHAKRKGVGLAAGACEMLVSFEKRFIFIANTKCASTAIESSLAHECAIALRHQKFGKHVSYRKMEVMLAPLMMHSHMTMEDFFVFGVIRDPVSWVVSWFNYRQRPEMPVDSPKSCHRVPFEDFVAEIVGKGSTRPFARIGSQFAKFCSREGGLATDYLIPLPRLSDDLAVIARELGISTKRGFGRRISNASPRVLDPVEVHDRERDLILDYFQYDRELYENSMAEAGKHLVEATRSLSAGRVFGE